MGEAQYRHFLISRGEVLYGRRLLFKIPCDKTSQQHDQPHCVQPLYKDPGLLATIVANF